MLILLQEDDEVVGCFALSRGAPGVRFDGAWRGLGMAGNSSVALELADVALDESLRVGGAGAGPDLVFSVVAPHFLVGLAAVNTGIAEAAATAATAHAANRRYADGGTLAEVPFIQHALADMDVKVRATRLLVEHAAHLAEQSIPPRSSR